MAQSPAWVNILSNNVWLKTNNITFDASWRLRVSSFTTLFDWKTLNADNTQFPLVLCATPITAWIDTFWAINFKEFAN